MRETRTEIESVLSPASGAADRALTHRSALHPSGSLGRCWIRSARSSTGPALDHAAGRYRPADRRRSRTRPASGPWPPRRSGHHPRRPAHRGGHVLGGRGRRGQGRGGCIESWRNRRIRRAVQRTPVRLRLTAERQRPRQPGGRRTALHRALSGRGLPHRLHSRSRGHCLRTGLPHLAESHQMVAATRVTAPPLRSAHMSLRLLTAAMPRISSPPRAPAQLFPDQARTTRIQYGRRMRSSSPSRRAGSWTRREPGGERSAFRRQASGSEDRLGAVETCCRADATELEWQPDGGQLRLRQRFWIRTTDPDLVISGPLAPAIEKREHRAATVMAAAPESSSRSSHGGEISRRPDARAG